MHGCIQSSPLKFSSKYYVNFSPFEVEVNFTKPDASKFFFAFCDHVQYLFMVHTYIHRYIGRYYVRYLCCMLYTYMHTYTCIYRYIERRVRLRSEGFNRESIANPDLRVCYHGKCCPRSWEVKSGLPQHTPTLLQDLDGIGAR